MKTVFIGCSTQSLPIAHAIQDELTTYQAFLPIIWNQGVIPPGRYTIPALTKAIAESDYTIFIFSADDEIIDPKAQRRVRVPRDNVIYESGLATGLLGLEHCFVFKERNATIPTDFRGLTVINYETPSDSNNIRSVIGSAVSSFNLAVNNQRSGYSLPEKVHSWLHYCDSMSNLRKKLSRSPRSGGFRYDAIVGISQGGALAADMLNHHSPKSTPLFCLEPNYDSQPNVSFDIETKTGSEQILNALTNFESILLMDDISRTGTTILEARDFLNFVFPSKKIRTAVVYVTTGNESKVNFFGALTEDPEIAMPYSMID